MSNILGNVILQDWIQLILVLTLMYLAYIDLRTFRIPDVITLPLILAGLFFNGLFKKELPLFRTQLLGQS